MNNHFAILLFCYFAILLQLLLLHIPSILTFPYSLKNNFPIPFVISQKYRNFAAY